MGQMEPEKAKQNIIQWNCRSIKPSYKEIKGIMTNYNPDIICLQETLLKEKDNITSKGYNTYNQTNNSARDNQPTGDSSIINKDQIPHAVLPLQTNLQSIAIKVSLHQTIISICSIYIPPKHKLNKNEIENLIEQLPTPIILMENFNAHSKMWECNDTNLTGKILESILESSELYILNDKTHTYLHPGNGTTSAIDLTLCSPLIFMDFHWGVHDYQCGSNHSPIFLKSKNCTPEETNPKWLVHKADWIKFNKLCSTLIDKELLNKPDPMSAFTDIIIKLVKQTIPKSSTKPHPKTNPWFTVECREAVKTRKKCSSFLNTTLPESIFRNNNKLKQKHAISSKKPKKKSGEITSPKLQLIKHGKS